MGQAGSTRRRAAEPGPYPPISDYALIGDCHSAALVSRDASVDWCCMPRFDSGSCFGRLLDWEGGGYCAIAPKHRRFTSSRRYVENTLVLETTFRTGGGEARLLDCFTMRTGGAREPYRQLLRVLEGVRGRVDFLIDIRPRFDYAEVQPWIRQEGMRFYSAIGGNDALLIWSDAQIRPGGDHDLKGACEVRAGERVRLSVQYVAPELIDPHRPSPPEAEELDRRLEGSLVWWRRWAGAVRLDTPDGPAAVRSAIVLKALTNAPTGAIAAAPTTSLPEAPGGSRNWDYRYSWVRDSTFSVRSLAELGCQSEADGFRRFVERSSAGNAEDLQILFGVGGERRLPELTLDGLHGYRGARPVRVGNAASRQLQLDVYGELLDLAWRWHQRGQSPDDDYWRFLVELVEAAATRWMQRDRGIWETRGRAQHFVHSKVMCWAALDRGIKLARECSRRAPTRRWTQVRNLIRREVEARGYDSRRGTFVRAFGTRALDASLLLIPSMGFIPYDDARMVRTADAIRDKLGHQGLLRRYRSPDGLEGSEGAFLACSFWLAECYARQGRHVEAREVFDLSISTANDLGLFAEEYDPLSGEMLGNFPLGLSHLSHIAASVALAGR